MRGAVAFAAFLLAATALPASADPVYNDVGAGLTCGLTATYDGKERFVQGTVTGGPWAPPPGARATIRCTVYAVYEQFPPQPLFEATSGESVGVTFLPPTAFAAPVQSGPGLTLTICTEVRIYQDGDVDTYYDDWDGDPSNGAQCKPATRHDDPVVDVFVAPPEEGRPCAYVDQPTYYMACSPVHVPPR